MKNSNKKIKSLPLGENFTAIEIDQEYLYQMAMKLTEVIDKVNELEEKMRTNKKNEIVKLVTEINKLESQPEECEVNNGKVCYKHGCVHIKQEEAEFTNGFGVKLKDVNNESQPEEHEHCIEYYEEGKCCGCKLVNPSPKQIIYTSEGDAVGEVEKKCEHLWEFANTGSLGTCVKCKIKSYYGYEPKD